MSKQAARIARMHYRTIEKQRGEVVRYQRHDSSEPVDITLVGAGAELEDGSATDDNASCVAYHWIAIAQTIKKKIGRLPENLDTITRIIPDLDDSLQADAEQTEVYTIARGDESRTWKPHGRHGGLIRIRSILSS